MLSVKNLERIRQRLLAEQERLRGHIDELTDMLRLEDRDIGSGEDDADIAARAIAYNGVLALLDSEQRTLEEVEDALQAMHEGTYGSCVVCGKEIGLARLQVRPYARRCIVCQERETG